MKGLFTLEFVFLISHLKGNPTRCVTFLYAGLVQKPTVVLFSTDEGNFFFSKIKKKINNNNDKKKILEKMLPGLFPICKYV